MRATIVQAQPQYTAQINWGNPLTTNLVHAGTPVNSSFDAVGKVKFSNVTKPLIKSGRSGLAWVPVPYSSYVSSDYLGRNPGQGAATPYGNDDQTVLWVVSCEYWSTFTGPYSVVRGPGGGDNSSNSLLINSNGEICYGTPNVFAVNSGVKIPLQKTSVIVFTSNAAGSTIYLDGKVIGYSATRIPFDDGYYNTINRLGYADISGTAVSIDGTQAYPYYTYAVAQWNKRCFNNTEVINLSQNPWQLFKAISTTNLDQIYYKFDSPTLIANTPTPTFVGTGRKAVARTAQPQSLATVDRANKFGRDCTFLWSAANPQYEASDNWIAAPSGYSFVASGGSATYTSSPTSTYGTQKGRASNSGFTVLKAKRFGITPTYANTANNLRVGGGPWTVSYLFRYAGPTFNQNPRVIVFGNSTAVPASSVSFSFGHTNPSSTRRPIMSAPLSYTVGGAFIGEDAQYQVGQYYLVTWVFRSDGTDCYVNGVLNSTTTNVHNNNLSTDNLSINSDIENVLLISAFNGAFTAEQVFELSQNPWQLFQPKSQPLYAANLPEPVQKAPVIRITPATTNLTDFPQVNTSTPIARDLYNVMVMGRVNSYTLTSINQDNSQISNHTPGNPASWPNFKRGYDVKYGVALDLPTSSGDAIRNIGTFKKFQKSAGATLLLVTKLESTTNAIGDQELFKVGPGYTNGLAIRHQSTGTEQQLRTSGYRVTLGMQYSPWATIPTDQILVLVLTTQPGVGEKLYVNGSLLTEQTAITAGLDDYFNNESTLGLAFPAVYQSSDSPNPTHYFAASWGRPLTDVEIRQISNNPLQLLRPQKHIQYLTTETPQPQPLIGGRHLKTRVTQPQVSGKFSGSNPVARKTTFLWTASNRGYDYAQTLTNAGSVNPQVVTTKSTNLGRALYATTTGAIEWEFREQTQYTQTSGNLRKGSNWTQGVVFRRNAAFANTEVYMVTNEGVWNHRIGIDVNGFVTAKVPGVNNPQISSDQSYALNEWIYAVLVHKQGDTRLYVNGQEQTQKLTGDFYTAGLGYVVFSPSGVDILTSFVSDREWSLSDIRSWTNNPWQLFQPEQHNFYTILPSGVIVPRNRFLLFFN